ncbi:MAG: hypothetical protein U0Y10_17675 [Spirosomataceae bacterium]
MKVLLKKKRLTRRFNLVNAGDTIFDTVKMPQDAHMIVGIKGVHRNLLVTPPVPPSQTKKFFYGVGNQNDSGDTFAQSLTSKAYINQTATFTATAGSNQYLFYAYPSDLGTPTFTFQSFQGGFILIGNVSITVNNQSGSYVLYRSLNANLSEVTVTVTH